MKAKSKAKVGANIAKMESKRYPQPPTWSQNGSKGTPNGNQMGAKRLSKWSQKEKRDPKGQKVRNRDEKARKRVRRSMHIDVKRVQNGANSDAKTHQKSADPLVGRARTR